MSQAVVELRQVALRPGGRAVLDQVDLTVAEGEFVYLVGKTGSGKTSLLRALYADLPLAAGRGRVAGHDLAGLRPRAVPALRRRLGIVFQEFNLLPDRDVAANLRFALRATGWKKGPRTEARIDEVLAAVGLPDRRAATIPSLSGGERQRVAFARALLNRPALLLADEVTGNLDPDTSRDVLDLMRTLNSESGVAVLFATHDYRLLDHFRARVVRCAEGRVFNE